jgi:hypothetical protein
MLTGVLLDEFAEDDALMVAGPSAEVRMDKMS